VFQYAAARQCQGCAAAPFSWKSLLSQANVAPAWTASDEATSKWLGLEGVEKPVVCCVTADTTCRVGAHHIIRRGGVKYLAVSVRNFAAEHPAVRCHVVFADLDSLAISPSETTDWDSKMAGAPLINNARQVARDVRQLVHPEKHVVFFKRDGQKCGGAATEGQRAGKVFCGAAAAGTAPAGLSADDAAVAAVRSAANRFVTTVLPFQNPTAAAAVAALQSGAWTDVDLAPMNKINDRLLKDFTAAEGHSGQLVIERKVYWKLASMPHVKRICEIGFNRGNSAALWLRANPTADVVMFDLFLDDHGGKGGERFLRSSEATEFGIVDGDTRLTIVKGSSLEKVPEWAAANPDKKCDIISVDGGHTYDIALADLKNMKALVNPSFHVGLIDDTNCDMYYCVDPPLQLLESQGVLRNLIRYAEAQNLHSHMRGITVFQYTDGAPAPDCPTCV